MNSPAHTIVNLALLGRNVPQRYVSPIVIGSFIPDLPIFLFYLFEKLVSGSTEKEIWSESYFHPLWQNFFDLFNSIPLIFLGLLAAWWKKAGAFRYLFASMLVHVFCDMPLHNDDAHRHFFPLSDWKFESPFSYWDPDHFGSVLAPLEVLAVAACSAVILRRYPSRAARLAFSVAALIYVAYFAFALVFWAELLP